MRILQLCKKFPYPAKDGETIAIFNLTKSFVNLGHHVTLLGMSTPKHNVTENQIPDWFKKICAFKIVQVDTKIRIFDAVKNLFQKSSYNIDRFYCKKFEQELIHLLKHHTFDIIHLEGLYLTPYISAIRQYSKAPIAMRSHNVEYEIWERLSENEKPSPKRAYLRFLAERMKEYEKHHVNNYDILIPITHRDGEKFKELGCEIPVFPLPAGVDFEELNGHAKHFQSAVIEGEIPSVFFLGSLDWLPNQHGINWFIENVWDIVLQELPNAKLHIAGRNFPHSFFEKETKNILIEGEVENATAFMSSKSIMIVPLFSGSGMRIKIIEAMAIGKTVISTTIGAEGLQYEDNKNIIIADDATSFANAVIKCLKEVDFAEDIAQNGMKLIKNKYDNQQLAKRLIDVYQQRLQ